ncbi:hypothetical protein ACYZX9_19280 (plasmid) [Sphingomonas citri]|jgi:DNA-directed RNA polymerase specialized sigma24 family protein
MSGVTLSTLLTAALTGRRYNHQRLGDQALRYTRILVARYAPKLPEDLHEDVVQEALLDLLTRGPAALDTTPVSRLFRRAVVAAIRKVRADYTPAGERTRVAPKGAKVDRVAAEDVGIIPDAATIEQATVADGDAEHLDFDQFESPAAAIATQQMQDRIDVERVLATTPPNIARALRLIHFDDEPVEMVAKNLALTRFAMKRRFIAVGTMWQAAA